jgi:predicted nucleic acid-binding protein
LAALALEYGVVVVSADSDFARFPEVRWVNPLV